MWNYGERYFSAADFAEVFQQRSRMVHWIVEVVYSITKYN